jgi:hypothetical protein
MNHFILDYILNNKHQYKLYMLLNHHYMSTNNVHITLSIINKLIILKNSFDDFAKFLLLDKNKEIMKKMIKVHNCNISILDNLFSIIKFFLINNKLNILDFDKSNIIDLQQLKSIISIFKSTKYNNLHDNIFYLLKAIIDYKIKENIIDKNISSSNNNNDNNNKSKLYDSEFYDLILIYSIYLSIIINNLKTLDINNTNFKFVLSNFVSYLYVIAETISVICDSTLIKIVFEKKITGIIIECYYILYERKIIENLDNLVNLLDPDNINMKIMIVRGLFHCFILFKNLRDYSNKKNEVSIFSF